MEVYEKSTKPLIDFYRKRGLLVTIEAEGTPEEIYQRTLGRAGFRPQTNRPTPIAAPPAAGENSRPKIRVFIANPANSRPPPGKECGHFAKSRVVTLPSRI